jgi:hypothetical protein
MSITTTGCNSVNLATILASETNASTAKVSNAPSVYPKPTIAKSVQQVQPLTIEQRVTNLEIAHADLLKRLNRKIANL